jgi:hypothetical protein
VSDQDQAEIAKLREQIEAFRLREVEDLRTQLTEAKAQAVHYRQEAERNVQIGHQIAREAEAERARLRERISALEQSHDTRQQRPTS